MNDSGLAGAVGGLGLLLIGLRVMTEALQSLAGSRMQGWLARVTRTPWSGALAGMVVTAALRSSGVTTVAAVGFVGAGMISFEQSLGIILGANIGTTFTGWIIAALGFGMSDGALWSLLLCGGALCWMLGSKRYSRIGSAVAGFALLFLGLGLLQHGLAGMADKLSLAGTGGSSWTGRLGMLGFGILFSLLTQSSSATAATALSAIATGWINLPQALAVVVGADVGTTATAWLASVGGTTDSRRTGLAHVMYNLLSGAGAFLLIPAYCNMVNRGSALAGAEGAVFATVAFHSLFNVAGVLLVLPFTHRFASFIRHLMPERSPLPSAVLDPRLIDTPAVACQTLHRATTGTAALALECAAHALTRPPRPSAPATLDTIVRSSTDCRHFIAALVAGAKGSDIGPGLPEILHALDHIDRLVDRCRDTANILHLAETDTLGGEAARAHAGCESLRDFLLEPRTRTNPLPSLGSLAIRLESDHMLVRHAMIEEAARGERPPEALDGDLDAHRWLRHTAWHAYRIGHYLTPN